MVGNNMGTGRWYYMDRFYSATPSFDIGLFCADDGKSFVCTSYYSKAPESSEIMGLDEGVEVTRVYRLNGRGGFIVATDGEVYKLKSDENRNIIAEKSDVALQNLEAEGIEVEEAGYDFKYEYTLNYIQNENKIKYAIDDMRQNETLDNQTSLEISVENGKQYIKLVEEEEPQG